LYASGVASLSINGLRQRCSHPLLNSIKKFTRNQPPEDDQTLVVVSFEEEARARVAS
jgi:hypothetical protein